MGAIESTEAGGNFWDSGLDLTSHVGDVYTQNYEEDGYYTDGGEQTTNEQETTVAETSVAAATTINQSPSPNRNEISREQTASPPPPPQVQEDEVSVSKNQTTTTQTAPQVVQPLASSSTSEIIRVSRASLPYKDFAFSFLFISHLILVVASIMFLIILFFKDFNPRKLHNLQRWFPQLCASVVTAALFGVACQTLFKFFPASMASVVIWTSAFLTFSASIMLISTSVPASLAMGALWFIFSICVSLYACWVSNRIKYAGDLLLCSLNTAKRVPGTYLVSLWILLIGSVWLVFWSFGVVCALSFRFAPLIILGLLASMAWTLETLRNVAYTTIARSTSRLYLNEADGSAIRWERCLHVAFTSSFGSICLGSLVVPSLHVLRVLARGLNRIHGDNEFMFSCADCFVGVMNAFGRYANNWAYVQVGVKNKAFVRASEDTWDLFKSKHLNVVIDTDLTSSFCVMSGIAGGMLCVIVSGGWTFATHKALTASISIVSFFIGYFLVRITMAVPQGAVCTHYVCYAENPTSLEFLSSPVPERLKELWAEADTEAAKEV